MPRRAIDPYAVFNFRLEIAGINVAGFSECSGLNAEAQMIEYREGTEGLTTRKLPGLIKHGNITLKRGVTQELDLFSNCKFGDQPVSSVVSSVVSSRASSSSPLIMKSIK